MSADINLPSEGEDVDFSAKRRLDQMKHCFRVLTTVFKRFSVYINWISSFYWIFNQNLYEEAMEHLNANPKWKDVSHYNGKYNDFEN